MMYAGVASWHGLGTKLEQAATALEAAGLNYRVSFNGKRRDELLNTELFDCLLEASVLIERWRITATQSGRTVLWATGHQHQKQF